MGGGGSEEGACTDVRRRDQYGFRETSGKGELSRKERERYRQRQRERQRDRDRQTDRQRRRPQLEESLLQKYLWKDSVSDTEAQTDLCQQTDKLTSAMEMLTSKL